MTAIGHLHDAPLATPIRWSVTRLENGYGVISEHARPRPTFDAFCEHELWWPLGPVGRAASRRWPGTSSYATVSPSPHRRPPPAVDATTGIRAGGGSP